MKKQVRKAGSMGPKYPKRTYKTDAGAQQYVKGKTAKERRDTTEKAVMASTGTKAFRGLVAADWAESSRRIKAIVGPKESKTNETVKMYNRKEVKWSKTKKGK